MHFIIKAIPIHNIDGKWYNKEIGKLYHLFNYLYSFICVSSF